MVDLLSGEICEGRMRAEEEREERHSSRLPSPFMCQSKDNESSNGSKCLLAKWQRAIVSCLLCLMELGTMLCAWIAPAAPFANAQMRTYAVEEREPAQSSLWQLDHGADSESSTMQPPCLLLISSAPWGLKPLLMCMCARQVKLQLVLRTPRIELILNAPWFARFEVTLRSKSNLIGGLEIQDGSCNAMRW